MHSSSKLSPALVNWVYIFAELKKRKEIHVVLLAYCLKKNYLIMPPNFIFWNFKKKKKKIAHNSLCTTNVHSTKYIMVWHQIKKSSWLSIFGSPPFSSSTAPKKGSENHESYAFSEKYKKAMFVCIKKAGRGKIEILDKLSSYAILSKGAIFHCSISKKKANSCLPAVIGVLFKWTILCFRKCNKNSQLLCKNSTFSLHR